MRKIKNQNGYILPITLLVLSCTLLWGSVLLLTLSDQYAASNDTVRQEQSRLLAYSGWNLALQQLETSGSTEPVLLEKSAGTAEVQLQYADENLITVQSEAEADGYRNCVQGTVRLLQLPWDDLSGWPLTDTMQDLQEASVFISDNKQITLTGSLYQPVAISSQDNQPVTVHVADTISCSTLYVYGDLVVEAPMQAEAVYVSGQINGLEQIVSETVLQRYSTAPDYRLQVVERIV